MPKPTLHPSPTEERRYRSLTLSFLCWLQGNKCAFCERTFRDPTLSHNQQPYKNAGWPTRDHYKVAKVNGGTRVITNIVAACSVCNTTKGDRYVEPTLLPVFTLEQWVAYRKKWTEADSHELTTTD